MSDVELPRKAAVLMRERAGAATPGLWVADVNDWKGLGDVVATLDGSSRDDIVAIKAAGGDARYIASMHPGVTLTIADARDQAVTFWWLLPAAVRMPLTVAARAYLGEDE